MFRRFAALAALAPLLAPAAAAGANNTPLAQQFFPIGGLVSVGALDTTYNVTPLSMANVIKMGAGNSISYAPIMSCLGTSAACGSAPTNDHQRASLVIAAQTQIDNQAEEQTLGIETRITTGARSAWTAGASYAANANVTSGSGIYRAAAACTAGSTAPAGYGNSSQQQSDGGCTWTWINATTIAGKLGPYIETAAEGGAGFSEGLVTNFQMQSAQYASTGQSFDVNQGAVGIEHDFKNNVADCGIGKCIGMSIDMSGAFQSWAAMNFDGAGGSHSGAQGAVAIGARFGNRLAQWADISIVDNSQIGLLIGNDSPYGGNSGPTNHGTASILDNANSPVALNLAGSYTNGIAFNGTFSGVQVAGHGWNVDGVGSINGYQAKFAPDTSHQVTIAYDTTNDQTIIQSTHVGSYNTKLSLNPSGGSVAVGTSGLQFAPITIAALPACSAANKGLVEFVSDTVAAAAPAWHGAVTGGGSTAVNSIVSCTGTGWQYD